MRTAPRVARVLLTTALLALAGLTVGCEGGSRERDFWGIKCISIQGPQRYKLAKQLADSLQNVDGLDPKLIRVIQDDEGGHVFYGRYERRWGGGDGLEAFRPDPTEDLALIQSLSYDQRSRPFAGAALDPYPAAQIGEPEWDLATADGYWSLQIAVFYNTKNMQQRKHAAAEYCRLLRERGEEAFYYHGRVMSSVCVGTFPESAVETVSQRTIGLDGRDKVTAVNHIVDPRLRGLQQRYPFNLENGHKMYSVRINPTSGEQSRTARESFLVKLPAVTETDDYVPLGGLR